MLVFLRVVQPKIVVWYCGYTKFDLTKAVSKANRMLGVIRRSYVYLDEECLMHVYKGYVPYDEPLHTV